MYRDLYLEALSRIEKLELDGESLQSLLCSLDDVRATMVRLKCTIGSINIYTLVIIFSLKINLCLNSNRLVWLETRTPPSLT